MDKRELTIRVYGRREFRHPIVRIRNQAHFDALKTGLADKTPQSIPRTMDSGTE
jgi:hypothetical protein